MDGLYLASNIGPLKTIGDGKLFIAINDLLNTDRFENVKLVAYKIEGSEDRIVSVSCLFKRTERIILFSRRFDFYKKTGTIDDYLKSTAEYGIGIADFEIESFIKLKDFYLQNKEVPEVI